MTRSDRAVVAVVWTCFAAFALWRSPIPGINEPQYLCKAKHFYAPDWCARDMFLESANAHWVFYAVIGTLTRFTSLDQTAWIGRILVWAGLAYGWVRLARLLLPGRWSPVWSACLFLALQAAGNLSGEWLIGGVEAKEFAYVALLLAIASACVHSYRRAAIELGLAISFHPVIGVWGVLALATAVGGRWFWPRAAKPQAASGRADAAQAPGTKESQEGAPHGWRSAVIPALLCLLLALPGLIPAVAMIASAPSKSIAHQADMIQVFERLDHHLDPADFSKRSYALYASLLLVWLVLTIAGDRSDARRFFTRFVLATLAIMLAGLVVGFWLRNPGLMKFYPFRMFDVFLPIAVSFSAVGMLERVGPATSRAGLAMQRALTAFAGPGVAIVALVLAFLAPGRVANASRMKYQENWLAFVDACRWIDQNTPSDSLFLTQKMNVGFKWYAQRAEFVTWKDCPQDADGILEWKHRLNLIENWRLDSEADGFTSEEFASLATKTGIDHALVWNAEPWQMKPLYRNRSFSVYRLAK